jgi:molybdate transport system substrate-binding protein
VRWCAGLLAAAMCGPQLAAVIWGPQLAAAMCGPQLAAAISEPQPAGLTVSAAISLTESLEEVARAYEAAAQGRVRFNFGGSNMLARQIVNGAPVDLFISADALQMDVAARAGAIDARTRVDLLGNRLAVLMRPEGAPVEDARALLRRGIRRIAIGDPAAVPAGAYARRYLEAAGLWDALQPKLVPVANVRAAVAAVENGSADAAIAYETDAAVSKRSAAVLVISGADAPPIVYPAAIVSATRNRAAAGRFLAFLRGPEASAIFSRHKFTPLASHR